MRHQLCRKAAPLWGPGASGTGPAQRPAPKLRWGAHGASHGDRQQPHKPHGVGEGQEKQRGAWMSLRHLLALTAGPALQVPRLGRREVSPCQAATVIFSLGNNSLSNQQYGRSLSPRHFLPQTCIGHGTWPGTR